MRAPVVLAGSDVCGVGESHRSRCANWGMGLALDSEIESRLDGTYDNYVTSKCPDML